MPAISILTGLILIAIGVVFFLATGSTHVTSLIPLFFGVALAAVGWLARRWPGARMHLMHAAVSIALVGLIVPGWRMIGGLISGRAAASAMVEQGMMSAVCLVFVVLCVRSFVQARLNRPPDASGPV